MRHLPQPEIKDPNLLVGLDTADDAGIYKLTDDLAMIQTIDFFTPIVNDPYMFGQIAAANALSDVYAMGGKPKTVLNVVAFPIATLGADVLAEILKGAAEKVEEAGAITVGGHSIDDSEPKFGLSVTGLVHPEHYYKNVGALPGDVLVITKPIGVGIQTSALKRDLLTEAQIEKVSHTMAQLNKKAAEALTSFHPHAVTDITGFGLLGHAYEMASGSNISITIHAEQVPILPGTRGLAEKNVIPGGSKSNYRWIKEAVSYDVGIDELQRFILCDAVTSGGLLISLPKEEAEDYVSLLHDQGIGDAAIIGEVGPKASHDLFVK
ncbi:selenide,water dikinase [Pullulanibacillus pueri]|uniref:Selenide, water dikinase n=1 Tax=Pullulanibacillus pueri TaxID=1437324 RepID=A0A8J2ZWQ5_9BACL|nr:selenide,water dikinase [Pullulanibacillus pueri]GGH81933.1 selenide, water dikinase [Pullulanibacillus pueri]